MARLIQSFDYKFYNNKTVLITGATGFKGSWLCKILTLLGANVIGCGLEPNTTPSLFGLLNLQTQIKTYFFDIRDFQKLYDVFNFHKPEIVFHLAAQPLVRDSYAAPAYTYETNVLGTIDILETIRLTGFVKSFVNVTTDKVYLNKEWDWGYRENEELNGYDPYSNSKTCSDLITQTYARCFFEQSGIAASVLRAGNVIGGGDFSKDRIIPDCFRAACESKPIQIRNPHSIRPFQHVLEPLFAYLLVAEKQYKNKNLSGAYNIGPDDKDCVPVDALVSMFIKDWGGLQKNIVQPQYTPHESTYLKLDCSKIKKTFDWTPTWTLDVAMSKTVDLYKAIHKKQNINSCINEQIREFFKERGVVI